MFKSRGTQPGKKSRHLRNVRRYLSSGTLLDSDGLLMNPYAPPLGRIHERIVVPDLIIHGLLTMLHLNLSHPTAYQLTKASFARYFFALDSEKYIKETISNKPKSNCTQEKNYNKVLEDLIL